MGVVKVMVTGSFDLFHAGHVRFLKEAKKFGDELYIGVVPDARVRQKKGKLRPVYPIQHRIEILSSNKYVTEAKPIPFYGLESSREGIIELVKFWKPSVWVDGAHGSAAKHAIPLSSKFGFSYHKINAELIHTTQVIEKIRGFYAGC